MELIIDSQLGFANLTEYDRLMDEADMERFFYGERLNRKTERTIIVIGETVVGFFEHGRVSFNGVPYYRTNRPYTALAHRGHGYMTKALVEWYANRRPAMSWIDDENLSSIRLFQNVGFRKVEAFHNKHRDGHFYKLD